MTTLVSARIEATDRSMSRVISRSIIGSTISARSEMPAIIWLMLKALSKLSNAVSPMASVTSATRQMNASQPEIQDGSLMPRPSGPACARGARRPSRRW